MRKGVETITRPSVARGGRAPRRTRQRGATAWLTSRAVVTSTTLAPAQLSQPPVIAGALALEQAVEREAHSKASRRCVLIVDRDPMLAETLARALQARFEPRQPVRFIRDGRLLGPVLRSPAADITVIDASAADDDAVECFRRLRAAPETDHIEAIFITESASSYRLSQLGADGGVVLRQPHSLDEIASFVGQALAEE